MLYVTVRACDSLNHTALSNYLNCITHSYHKKNHERSTLEHRHVVVHFRHGLEGLARDSLFHLGVCSHYFDDGVCREFYGYV